MRFTGKVAILSGAASGMGLLAAQCLCAEGARVVLTDVNQDAVEAAAAEIRDGGGEAIGLVVDVRDYEQVKAAAGRAMAEFGSIDILLNFAGGAESRMRNCHMPFHEMPVEVLDWGLDVNLKGTVYFCHAVMGTMLAQKRGVIITLGSVSGLEGAPSAMCYSAAKSGMLGLTKSLALAGAAHGVRACCVSPGPVLTREAMAHMKTPMGRAAEPQEVVDLILYLCSNKAGFITGSNHVIDGGRTLGGFR